MRQRGVFGFQLPVESVRSERADLTMSVRFFPAIFFLLMINSCSSFQMTDRFEGLVHGKNSFRVYVRFDEYEISDPSVRKALNERIREHGAIRLNEILNGFSEMLKNTPEGSDLSLFALKKDLHSDIAFRRVSEDSVEAFVDFDISERCAVILKPLLVSEKKETAEDE